MSFGRLAMPVFSQIAPANNRRCLRKVAALALTPSANRWSVQVHVVAVERISMCPASLAVRDQFAAHQTLHVTAIIGKD